MRRLLMATVIVCLLLGDNGSVFAIEKVQNDDIYIEEHIVKIESKSYISVRTFLEELGFLIGWDDDLKEILMKTNKNEELRINIDERISIKENNAIKLTDDIHLINNKSYISINDMRKIMQQLERVSVDIYENKVFVKDVVNLNDSFFVVESDGIFTKSPSGSNPAFHYKGSQNRVYFGYYNSKNEINVKYWDEDGNFVSNAVALWHQWGKSSSGFVIGDDHANPSIIVLKHQKGEYEKNNGKLLVAAAEHGWRLEIKKSVFTENITAWEPSVRIVDKGATYARLVELSDGQILLFARMSNSAPNSRATYYYWVSDDSGQTWSEPKLLIDSDMGTKDAIYLELVTNSENNEIHFMFNIVKYNDLQSGKNRYQDIYYIYYDLKDDKWKKRNSDVVDLPLTPSKIDYVYKSNVDDWTYLSDIKIDNNGIPRLLSITDINRFEYEEITVNEHYFNDKWVTDTISYTGRFNYVNMASYDGNNTNMIYTFPEDSNGNSQMEIWRKKDGKWSKYVQITNDDYGHHARPVSIVGSESSLRVLWNYITMYEGSPYTNWKSMIMGYKDNLENDVGLGQDDK